MSTTRVAVVGGGITGLTAAWRLAADGHEVVVLERDTRLGGKLLASPFGGLDAVDEGPDAFLARVPWATGLAHELGIDDHQLTSPATGSAFVAHRGGLHPIPAGLVLGVPAGITGLARSPLMSWRGKARAGLDLVLPRRSTEHDSLGRTIRERFGAEVLELLVDPLVGSINAGDSDHLSLRASTPQIAPVAERSRSLLLGLRGAPKPTAGGPIFLTPVGGVAALADRLVGQLPGRGVVLRTGTPVARIERDGAGFRIDGEPFDAVVVACPSGPAADLLTGLADAAVPGLRSIDTAGVVMVTLRVTDRRFLDAMPRGSGYLVPKPDQMHVTAVSFASRKWAHLAPPAGGELLRVSLGRVGRQTALGFDDETCVAVAMRELAGHLGVPAGTTAEEARVTRWPAAFPQYEPGHLDRVTAIERAVARDVPGLVLAGASYRGVGIPACIKQAGDAAVATSARLAARAE